MLLFKCTIMFIKSCIMLITILECAIDVNLAEYEYLANHLSVEECRHLIVFLHNRDFYKPSDEKLSKEKQLVSQDMGCLQMLLHWNSAKYEGLGKTHIELGHRLNQIGRNDLAEWLSQTVFKQLSEDIDLKVKNQLFKTKNKTKERILLDACFDEDDQNWTAWDMIILLLVLGLTIFILLGTLRIAFASISFKRSLNNLIIVESNHQVKSLLYQEGRPNRADDDIPMNLIMNAQITRIDIAQKKDLPK